MTPQGWYPDPTDATQMRWWDGQRWTEHVQSPAPQSHPRQTQPATDQLSGGYQQPQGQWGDEHQQSGLIGKAPYAARAAAYLIDCGIVVAPMIVSLILARIVLVTFGEDVPYGVGKTLDGVPSIVNMLLVVAGLVGTVGFGVWNLCLRQGRTGQSIGKMKLGLRLVDVSTGAPLGAGKTFLRYLVASALSGLTFGFGALIDLLWPLRDARGQRLTDKVMSSVVTPK